MRSRLTAAAARSAERKARQATLAIAFAAAAALTALLIALGAAPTGAALIAAPIPLVAALGTLHAYTEVTPTGIRTRHVIRTHEISWSDITSISIVTSQSRNGDVRRVSVTGTRYRHWYLGAPFQHGADLDGSFDRELARLRAAWKAAQVDRLEPEPYRLLRRRKFWLQAVAVGGSLIVASVSLITAVEIGPAWAAHRGQGVHGTFAVTRVAIGKSTTYYGSFDDTTGSDHRGDTRLADDPGQTLAVGDRVAAIDAGGPAVYLAEGSHSWIQISLIESGGAAFLAGAASKVANDSRRRRRESHPRGAAG